MPLYKPQDFAIHCGFQSWKQIAYAVGRGDIVKSGKWIDSDIDTNKRFAEKWRNRNADKLATQPTTAPIAPTLPIGIEPPATIVPEAPTGIAAPVTDLPNSFAQLDVILKQQNILKVKAETEKLQIFIAKQKAELIPVDLVNQLIVIMSESNKTSYLHNTENLLIIMAQQHGLDNTALTSIKASLTAIINTAVDEAAALAKMGIRNIVNEYRKTQQQQQQPTTDTENTEDEQ
jgi:hypothetical protein